MKILIAEPDEYYHTLYVSHLGSLGELMISKDGTNFRSLIRKFSPDVIITELLLADAPVYPIFEELQKERKRSNCPLIVFSKVDNLEDIEASLNYGVSGYFVKGKDHISDIRKFLLTYAN